MIRTLSRRPRFGGVCFCLKPTVFWPKADGVPIKRGPANQARPQCINGTAPGVDDYPSRVLGNSNPISGLFAQKNPPRGRIRDPIFTGPIRLRSL